MTAADNRRLRRAEDPHLAVTYQLEHVRDQGEMQALVLADDDGLHVAMAGDPGLCQELAAAAPMIARSALKPMATPRLWGTEVAVRGLRMFGQLYYIAAVGGGDAREALLHHSSRGVTRILGAN